MWWTRLWAFLRCCHVTCQFHGQLFASLLELFANRKHISWIAITTYPLFRKDLWRIFRNEKKYYCVKMIRRFGFNCDLLEQDMLLQMLVRFQKGCRFLISVFCCHCPCTASCEETEQHFSYMWYIHICMVFVSFQIKRRRNLSLLLILHRSYHHWGYDLFVLAYCFVMSGFYDYVVWLLLYCWALVCFKYAVLCGKIGLIRGNYFHVYRLYTPSDHAAT